jgi:hypothetical protein
MLLLPGRIYVSWNLSAQVSLAVWPQSTRHRNVKLHQYLLKHGSHKQDSADRRKRLNKSKPSGKLSNEVCDVHSVSKSHSHNVVHRWLKLKRGTYCSYFRQCNKITCSELWLCCSHSLSDNDNDYFNTCASVMRIIFTSWVKLNAIIAALGDLRILIMCRYTNERASKWTCGVN